jgi:hypothetical protein
LISLLVWLIIGITHEVEIEVRAPRRQWVARTGE